MRETIRHKLKIILFKKWFWVGVVLLFIFAITTDLIITFGIILNKFYFGDWNPYLFAIGITSAMLGAFGAKKKILESQNLREIGKLLFFIALIWTFKDYGFGNMILFMAGILITTRVLKWFTPKRQITRLTPLS